MTKHTSGPWKHEEQHGRRWISAKRGRVQIADVSDIEIAADVAGIVDTDVDATIANADLLAASPDLLQAAKSLVDLVAVDSILSKDTTAKAILKAARKAIAKAEGRSP